MTKGLTRVNRKRKGCFEGTIYEDTEGVGTGVCQRLHCMSHCIPGLEPEVDVYLCSTCIPLSILIGNHTRMVPIDRVGIPYSIKNM